MSLPFLIVPLAAAAASASGVPTQHNYRHAFVSPMGEPFYADGSRGALEAWFNQADRNRDGVLTTEEMQADAERFFATLDADHDGEIGPDEITHYENVIAPGMRMNLLDLPEPVIAVIPISTGAFRWTSSARPPTSASGRSTWIMSGD